MKHAPGLHRPVRSFVGLWNALRFRQLLVFIIIGLLLEPFTSSHAGLSIVFQFIFLNALLVALSSIEGHERWLVSLRAVLVGLWAIGAVLRVVCLTGLAPALDTTLLAVTVVVDAFLMGTCVAVLMKFVLRGHDVDAERIFAAVVAYFLMAFTFASIYDLLVIVRPASFFAAEAAGEATGYMTYDSLYFSFVTITTLGYGDIVPHLPLARALCIIEAVAGQFYIAVVIAWLVSSYVGSRRARS
ncbi:MAG: ion channel [Candidatus Krumholzibacteria bacterium]|nr:ion channel [Candidatus Krumholzibacteria bacterium]MDH5269732.1 ion channel [Candidatus Krumholzibacteria bacterium]